ncbi:MAG TPA: bifunctional precorrin-2 dehydrogenase/sirohydrochlorin ferrochelatase [Chloroflexota bacterium]|nr:bifunctional precorrin-2 dehydrogenase/sirohydrochlorin ferrochelatase [Chloroflexota bacterium]
MSYYPVFLDLRGQRCVVLGGSDVAAAKASALLDTGAQVTIIASELGHDPALLTRHPERRAKGFQADQAGANLRILRRDYQPGDLAGARLAIDAAGDAELTRQVRAEANAAGVLLNVVDRADQCDFIAPAVVRRGPLQVAISTSGESPFMASALRRQLEQQLGPEWGEFVALVGEVRRKLRGRGVPVSQQQAAYELLMDSNVPQLLREGAVAAARRQAKAIVRQALSSDRLASVR